MIIVLTNNKTKINYRENFITKLKDCQHHINTSGFTIVELLVVIVIIGILAAITIVSYTGITQRAENSKTISAVDKYATALALYATENGIYPAGSSYPCLSNSNGLCARVDGSGTCFGAGGAASVAAFDSAILTVINTLPQTSNQKIGCSGNHYEGAYYYTADGKNAYINYYLSGNQTCPSMNVFTSVSSSYLSDMTLCQNSLPILQ